MALLGEILFNNKAYLAVQGIVTTEMFAIAEHARIYEACGKLIDRGMAASPITVKDYFEQDNSLADVGGTAYLGRLASTAVTIVNAADYARTIRDCFLRRKLISVGTKMQDDAYAFDFTNSAEEQIAAADAALRALVPNAVGTAMDAGAAASAALDKAAQAEATGTHISGVPSGFRALDRLCGGFEPKDLIVVGARPSMGKSALALWMSRNIAMAGMPVLFFTLEMPTEQMGARLTAPLAGLTAMQMRVGDIGDAWPKLFEAQEELAALPLWFDKPRDPTVSAMHMEARRVKRERGLGIVVIDHLGFVTSPASDARLRGDERIGEITRAMKRMAEDLDVPVLLLHQLSRATETRDDPRPELSDLRGSGSIEQDADVVMFIFRESYYLKNHPPKRRDKETSEAFIAREADWQDLCDKAKNKAEIIVRKQRNGPPGTVRLFFHERYARFQNLNDDDGQGDLL